MKTNLLNFSISLPLLLFFLFTHNAFSCQCRGLSTPYEAFKAADAVFVGKIVSIKDSFGKEIRKDASSKWWKDYDTRNEGDSEFNQFVVQERFKGDLASEVTIGTSINMCQHGFSSGETSLVYAYKGNSDETLWAGLYCSRTADVKSAWADINFLRELMAKKPEPRIYGAIYLRDDGRITYLEKIKVIAQRKKRRYITFTDKNGLFRFPKLPNGKYRIFPELPRKYADDFWSLNRLEEITLQKDREDFGEYFTSKGPTAYGDFAIRWNNSISGRVLDAEGKQIERATIRLLKLDEVTNDPLNDEQKIAEYVPWDIHDKNSRKFVERGSSPGKYILALEVFAPFVAGNQKLRMYYPQATIIDKAEIINIGESTKRTINLKLPNEFIVRDIEGSFIWGSGVPIEGGWVSIEKMENSDHSDNVVYESLRPKDGKFKFQVFENAEYWIHGEFDHQKAKPIKIKVGKANEAIRLCITLIKGYKPENCSNN